MESVAYPNPVLLLIHIGPTLPPYLFDCVRQIRFFTNVDIHILVQDSHIDTIKKLPFPSIIPVSIESIPISDHHTQFIKTSRHNPHFREGFWRFTSERFFTLYDYAQSKKLSDIFHIENDNLIFLDFTTKLDLFRKKSIWAVFDHPVRCIPSFMYFKNWVAIKLILDTFLEGAMSGQNDMVSMAKFRTKYPNVVGALPIVTSSYPDAIPSQYYEYADAFGMVFDAAWLGQYIGGVDPRNMIGDTRGFVNETCIATVDKVKLEWKHDDKGLRRLYLNNLPVVNLHIHSKDLQGNCSTALLCNLDIVKGELYQHECDIYCGLSGDLKNPYFASPSQQKKFFDLSGASGDWANPAKIFCYGHRLAQFQNLLVTQTLRPSTPFILVVHNSDQNITDEFLPLIEHPLVTHVYAQNPLITHPKLTLLPIGQANSCYRHGKADFLAGFANLRLPKRNDFYFFFNIGTNKSAREKCRDILIAKGLQFGTMAPYPVYVQQLAASRFAICPDGNGADSHRIWEALYLGTIPIALSNPFTEQLKAAGLPIVLLNAWDNFDPKALETLSMNYPALLEKLKGYNRILRNCV